MDGSPWEGEAQNRSFLCREESQSFPHMPGFSSVETFFFQSIFIFTGITANISLGRA